MARSSWIPLALGGIGSVLLISGIQGESLGEVLKGEFGKGTKHETPNPEFKGGDPQARPTNLGAEGSEFAPNPGTVSLPNSPVPPLPQDVLSSQSKLKAIASYLKANGINNPTQAQINEASYHLGYTTRREYEEANRERRLVGGL